MAAMAQAREIPASVQMLQMLTGKWVSRAISVAAEFGIADLLSDGEKSTAELAAAAGVHEQSLYRVLRALASVGVFEETGSRRFALTPLAACLRNDAPDSVRGLARFLALPLMWDSWRELSHSVRTGETGMRRLGIANPFDYLQTHPDEAEVFNHAMTEFSHQSAPAVAEAYDFGRFRKLVDVAGGHGFLLTTVLDRYPALHGVLFDMPPVVEGARAVIAQTAAADRCETVAGDFFQAVPEGADGYMMKHILHDWDDRRATAILRNCRRAMRPDGRVLVIEMVIPEGNQPFFGKLLDLEMLSVAGGRERTEEEFRQLFAAAGFELTGIVPTAAPVSLVEGRLVD